MLYPRLAGGCGARPALQVPKRRRVALGIGAHGQHLVWAALVGVEEHEPPAVWLTYPDAVNGAVLHPFLPLLGVAVGQRHFPLPRDDDSDDEEEGGAAEAAAEAAANERQTENGLQVWLLPHPLGEAPATGEPPPLATVGLGEGLEAAPSGAKQAEAITF